MSATVSAKVSVTVSVTVSAKASVTASATVSATASIALLGHHSYGNSPMAIILWVSLVTCHNFDDMQNPF